MSGITKVELTAAEACDIADILCDELEASRAAMENPDLDRDERDSLAEHVVNLNHLIDRLTQT